jgi:hypothetical protein
MKFIRKNGRIIPIRDKREVAKGAAEVAAGASIGAAGGAASLGVVKKAANMAAKSKAQFRMAHASRIMTREQFSLPGIDAAAHASKTARKAAFGRYSARKLFRTRNRIMALSIAAGTAVAAHGTRRIEKEITNDKQKRQFTATAAGVGTLIAASAFATYYSGMGFKGAALVKNVVARFKGIRRPGQTSFDTKYGRTKI